MECPVAAYYQFLIGVFRFNDKLLHEAAKPLMSMIPCPFSNSRKTRLGVRGLGGAGLVEEGADAYGPLSGITLHRVVDGRIDDGTFLPLDPGPGGR